MDTTNYKIQTVTLNVKDLNKMKHFYQEIMGLDILSQTTNSINLGIKKTHDVLLILEQVTTPPSQTSGLYHIAYLLPDRRALGNFLRHIAITRYPLQGASDHGYSEALYLADPEGNGIEVYVDKPREQWTFKENGIIVGVTEPMDVEGVLASADEEFETLVAGSIIGHVHLSVSTIPETNHFFRDILGFTITTEFGEQAAFYGKDGYHHQFAGNIWQSRGLPQNDEQELGLRLINVAVSKNVWDETLIALKQTDTPYTTEDDSLIFYDPNGIKFSYTAFA